ncbi:MAG: hypothetical protein SGI72_06980 [Planctomycetota bacterium]|nr:hypothetical protein [Planctomycetota bacterium]
MSHHRVVLLGPQRLQPTLNKAVAALKVTGPLAVITAGWEERESEDQEMRDHLGAHTVNLRVYQRVEDVMEQDRELAIAIRERQDRLRVQHELYRMRLQHAMAAARELLHRETVDGYSEMLEAEREAAIEAVRTLDGFHLMKVVDVHHEFEDRMRPLQRDSVVRHRREMARILHESGALCIAGGHVVALLHRMRLFDVLDLVDSIPIFAWSAGAMALGSQVVLFHDSPPHGLGNAELFEEGLNAYSGVLPLPHAKKRLHLHDRQRVSLFARRFAPAQVVALDPLTKMEWDGKRWNGDRGTLRLTERGVLAQAGVA